MMKFKALAIFLFLTSICSGGSVTTAGEIVVLLDPNVRPYVEALAGFKQVSDMNIKVFTRREDGDLSDERALIKAIRARNPDQILVIGSEAMMALAGEITDIPILFSMVLSPQDKWKSQPKNLTGVSMSVSPESQMKVLSTLLPALKHVAVVYDPDQSSTLVRKGEEVCESLNQKLISKQTRSTTEAVSLAEALLNQNAAYWMIPDQLTRSKDLVRYLFFAARNKKKVLIGLSDKYVRAGALFAFSVQNDALGRQVARLSKRLMAGGQPNRFPIEVPRDIDLSINLKVAKQMGITVPDSLMQQAKSIY